MQIRNHVQSILEKACQQAGFSDVSVHLEHPQDMSMGDYATAIAMQIGKKEGIKPTEVAGKIIACMDKDSYVDKVEVAGPGFINIYLSNDFFANVCRDKNYLLVQPLLANDHILVEHTSPNLFKPFHLGHLVNNFYGTAIANLYRAVGAEVRETTFPSDISPGIAKTVWALKQKGWAHDFTIEQIGEAYAFGSEQYKESEEAKGEIDLINRELYDGVQGENYDIYERGKALSFDYFTTTARRLGTKHDSVVYESETEKIGKEIVKNNIGNIFTQSQGAVIFEGSKYGLFDNVFINSAGFGTYLTKDLGLIERKSQLYPDITQSVYVTDIEQKQHFQLVKKAAELLDPGHAERLVFLHHGRLSLTSGKISSRHGNVPLAEDLIDTVKETVVKKSAENDKRPSGEEAETIAQAALRYAILKSSMGKNIVFDFEKDLALEGNTGPYLLYTYVRARSIMEKAESSPREVHELQQITALDKLLYRYPEIVMAAFEKKSPHEIATYLHELASEFNAFYASTMILDTDNPDYDHNLRLVVLLAEVLEKGLGILGIETVTKM